MKPAPSSKLRIIAVQTSLKPIPDLGGSISDGEFLTRLADRGVQVHLLIPAGVPHMEHRNFIPHYYGHCLSGVPYLRYYTRDMDVALALRGLLPALRRVDWVRFNSPYRGGLGAYFTARKRVRLWGNYHHCEDSFYQKWNDSWLPSKCDLVTCVSKATRDDLLVRCPKLDNARIAVVPNGVDIARFHPDEALRFQTREKLGITEAEVLVLFAGRLIPRKGVSELLTVWNNLSDCKNARLVVIGGLDADHTELTQAVKTLVTQDTRVRHLEWVTEIADYFKAADVFFLPTRLEGFGMVVAEAMATGLAVVTTDSKGVSEVIDESCALHAPVGDASGLAVQLRRVIVDQGLRVRLGTAGMERARTCFSWDSQIDKLCLALGMSPANLRADSDLNDPEEGAETTFTQGDLPSQGALPLS